MPDTADIADVCVLDAPDVAAAALEPTRARLLAALAHEPGSAAQVATRLGLPRQRVGHHLRALEGKGLVVEVGTRRHGGLTERVLAASAQAYVVSTAALGDAGADPARIGDRLSAAYLVAVAARAVREVGQLLRGAERAGRRLPSLTVETEIRFASAADRAAFADDLAACVRDLTARYHAQDAPGGRWYRLVAVSHPRPAGPADPADQGPRPPSAEEASA